MLLTVLHNPLRVFGRFLARNKIDNLRLLREAKDLELLEELTTQSAQVLGLKPSRGAWVCRLSQRRLRKLVAK